MEEVVRKGRWRRVRGAVGGGGWVDERVGGGWVEEGVRKGRWRRV